MTSYLFLMFLTEGKLKYFRNCFSSFFIGILSPYQQYQRSMLAQKLVEADIYQMTDICLSGIEDKTSKTYKNVCSMFLKQFLAVQRHMKPEQVNLTISVRTTKVKTESNQSLILSCLLYLFIKVRSLKVSFQNRLRQGKHADREKSITLILSQNNKIDLHGQFYKKLEKLIEKKRQQYRQSFSFFGDISFRANDLLASQPDYQVITQYSYLFISQFYNQLNTIFSNKQIYLMKNFFGAVQVSFNGQKEYLLMIMNQMKNLFALVQVYLNLSPSYLLALAETTQRRVAQVQSMEQQDANQSGVFKQFKGTPLEYLQKLVIAITGEPTEMLEISSFIKNTPNLIQLEVHNKLKIDKTPPGIQKLLHTVVESTQFVRKVALVNFSMPSIEEDLLYKLYVNCPFLVQLCLGLKFRHTIPETYALENGQNRKAMELQRSKQIILDALGLRNITLSNSYQMMKLLLKKGYNFISALQIIDCIEPICL